MPDVEEVQFGPPHEVAAENARRKAVAAAGSVAADALVLGVDTIVCLDSRIYGKPADEEQARETLLALRARRHEVISGICVVQEGRSKTASARTGVQFRAFEPALLDWYLASGEWRERAGGYAIQGRGAALVSRIEGDYLGVVGLPVNALLEMVPGLLPGS